MFCYTKLKYLKYHKNNAYNKFLSLHKRYIITFNCRLNTINEGRVAIGDLSGFLPCTPNGCIELIKKCVLSIRHFKIL